MSRTITRGALAFAALIATMSLCTAQAATSFINEDFSSTASGSTPPAGWTSNLIAGSASFDFWRFGQSGVFHSIGNPGTRTGGGAINSRAAFFDSDNFSTGGGVENVALVSPFVNTTGYSDVRLKWDQDYHGGYQSGDAIFVEVWDGTTWNVAYTDTTFSTSGGAATVGSYEFDVSAYAANRANVQVRFRFRGNWSWWWIVDNVQLYSPHPDVSSIVRGGANPTAAASVSFTVTFTESVTGVDASDFALTTAGLTGASVTGVSGAGTTWTVTANTGTGSGTLRLDVVDDDTIVGLVPLGGTGAGNGNFTTGQSYTVDRTGPGIVAGTRSADGNYTTGQTIDVTVGYDEAVTVTGAPFVALTIGATARNAAYLSGSGTTTLTFRYTVQAADQDLDGVFIANAISANGGTLRDALGNDATLTPLALSGSFPALLVNGDVTPNAFSFTAVTGQPLATPVTSNTVTINGIDSTAPISVAGGAYSIGCTAVFTTGAATVANGDTVCVRHATSAAYATQTNTTLTVGGGAATFSSTTLADIVPGAPTITTATPGNTQGTIAFNAPAPNGGSAITGYTVNCTPGPFAASAAASPITVTGLANGTAYSCTVAATNAAGAGPASAPMSVTPRAMPGAPTITTATPGNGQATIAFTPPASDGGSAITQYTVSCTPGPLSASGAASPITVTGLANGTAYSCTVAATNAAGAGPASAPMSVTPRATAGAPTITAATPGNGVATIAFTPPASDGGAAITQYTVSCTPGAFSASGTASPLTVTGLANGTAYLCIVTATNAAGAGIASAAIVVTPSFQAFTGPSAMGNGMITASFTGGGPACVFVAPQFIGAPPGSAPVPPTKPLGDIVFPMGLFDFSASGCALGATLSFTITYPGSLPPGTQYWKYGPTAATPAPHWYVLPATITGNTASFTITDGGLGDDDLTVNGTIVDQGGPGSGGPGGPALGIPTLDEWGRWLLMLLLAASGAWALRRRRG